MMTENAKLERSFCVVVTLDDDLGAHHDVETYTAKTPRDAATKAFNGVELNHAKSLEVFEIGRGRRYVRTTAAVPAGKAE